MVRFCRTSLEEGLKSEGVYVVVVGGGVGRVDSARAAAGPGYLKDVFEGRLVKIINPRAVDATVRDPLRRSPRKEGSQGRWKRIDGSRDREQVPCVTS
jgi:hypothetical protein